MTRPTKQTRPRLSIFWLPEIALRYLPTWQKLALLIVVGSVIPLLAVGWLANTRSQAALDLAARDKLELVRTARAMQVQEFFRLLRADAKSIAENPTVVDAVQAFAAARTRAASAMAAEFQYQQAVVRYGAYLGAISDAYDEMLLLDVNGNVVYSSTGDKPPTDTNETLKAIAEGVTRGHVLVTDMSLDPETGRAVGYAATEVVTQTGTTVGFVAVQYTGDQLGTLTADYSGLGVTGDVYLVGADGRLRSPTRFGTGGSDDADVAGNDGAGEVLRLAVDTVAAQQARRGVTGAWRGTNYAGEQVISAYQPLGIGGLDWAIVAEMSEHEALAAANDLTRELATVTGVLVALTALLGLYVTTALTRPMRAMVRGLGHLAAGELNVDNMWVRGRDEAAQMMESFNRTVTNLRELIGGVTESARAVEQAAAEFEQQSNEAAAAGDGAAQAIEQVAVGARGEQEALEETRRVLIDLTQAIEQTAAGAQTQAQDIQTGSETMTALSQSLTEAMEALQRVSDASARNATSAEQGTAAVREGMAAMEQMRQFVMDAATRVRELGQRTAQIDEILEVLREIAEQTNLLALNAAIEAARVGAQGRGFAIVAEEVRSLAVRSNESAQDIGELIAAIQGGTEEVVSLMNQGATHAEAAAAVAETSGEALEAIVTAARGVLEETAQIERRLTETVAAADTVIEQIERVAAVAAEHSAAAEEMAAGSTQASASMDSVAALSTENAAAASQGAAEVGRVAAGLAEIARGAMTLTEIAARLREDVNKFKL